MNTHALKADGAAFSATSLTRVDPNSTKGQGVAVCSCGETSINLPTRAARKAWHAEHKEEAVTADTTEQDTTEQDTTEQDTTEQDTEQQDTEETEAQPSSTRVYTGGYAAVMSKAVAARADQAGLSVKVEKIPSTTPSGSGWPGRKVTVSGNEEEVGRFTDAMDDLEATAMADLSEWQKSDPSRKEQTNSQRYAGAKAFLVDRLAR